MAAIDEALGLVGDDDDLVGTVPTQNGVTLDRFNQALRQSPRWRQFMIERFGKNPNDPTVPPPAIRLSDAQRKQLQRELESAGFRFPGGMEIDPAGNVNQNQGFWAHAYFYLPALTAAALVTLGAAGWGPLAVLSGGGGSGGTSVLASSSLVNASTPISSGLFAAPAAITSAGVSSGIGVLASSSLVGAGTSISSGLFSSPAAIASQGVSNAARIGALAGSTAAATASKAAGALAAAGKAAGALAAATRGAQPGAAVEASQQPVAFGGLTMTSTEWFMVAMVVGVVFFSKTK